MRRLVVRVLGAEVLAIELGTKPPKPVRPRLQASGSLEGSELAEDGQRHLGVGFTPTGAAR